MVRGYHRLICSMSNMKLVIAMKKKSINTLMKKIFCFMLKVF